MRPVILEGIEQRPESSGSASSWSLSAIDDAVSRVRLSLDERVHHLASLDFSTSPRVIREGRSSSSGSRIRLQVSLTHESSVDQESSQLSQDSSNGSISQTDDLNEEEPSSLTIGPDPSLRFRTGLSSPTASTPVGESPAPRVSSPPLGRALGTSVIVRGGRTEASSLSGGDDGGSEGTTLHSASREGAADMISEGQVLKPELIHALDPNPGVYRYAAGGTKYGHPSV